MMSGVGLIVKIERLALWPPCVVINYTDRSMGPSDTKMWSFSGSNLKLTVSPQPVRVAHQEEIQEASDGHEISANALFKRCMWAERYPKEKLTEAKEKNTNEPKKMNLGTAEESVWQSLLVEVVNENGKQLKGSIRNDDGNPLGWWVLITHGFHARDFIQAGSDTDIDEYKTNVDVIVDEDVAWDMTLAALSLKFHMYTMQTDRLMETLELVQNTMPSEQQLDVIRGLMASYLRENRIDVVKYGVKRLADVYNEYALLVNQIVFGSPSPSAMFCLILGSVSVTFANGGRSLPETVPGQKWFGEGDYKITDDPFKIRGQAYADAVLKAAVPLVIAAVQNLAVLGKYSSVFSADLSRISSTSAGDQTGFGDDDNQADFSSLVLIGLSQAYLCVFTFSIICVTEASYRVDGTPLGSLREKLKEKLGNDTAHILGRLVVVLLFLLECGIPVVVNLLIYAVPNEILAPSAGFVLFFATFFIRFLAEPIALATAWKRCNLCFVVQILSAFISYLLFFFTCDMKRLGEAMESLKTTMKDQLNNVMYLFIFGAAFGFTVYALVHSASAATDEDETLNSTAANSTTNATLRG